MVRFFSCLWSRAGESILMGMVFPGAAAGWCSDDDFCGIGDGNLEAA